MSKVTKKWVLCASAVIVVIQLVQCQRPNRHDRQDFSFQNHNIYNTRVLSNEAPKSSDSPSSSMPPQVDSSLEENSKIKRLTWLKNQMTHCGLFGSKLKFLKKVEDVGDDYDTIRFKVPEQLLQENNIRRSGSVVENNNKDTDSIEAIENIDPHIEFSEKQSPQTSYRNKGLLVSTTTILPNHRPFTGPIQYHGQLNPRPKKPWTNPLSWSSDSYSKPVELIEFDTEFVPINPPNYNMIKRIGGRIDKFQNLSNGINQKAVHHLERNSNEKENPPDIYPVFRYIESLPTFTTQTPNQEVTVPHFHTQYKRVIVKNAGTENNHINSNIQHISKKKRPYTIYMTTERAPHVQRVTPSTLWEVFPLAVPGVSTRNESNIYEQDRYNRIKTFDSVLSSNTHESRKITAGANKLKPRIMPKKSLDWSQVNHEQQKKTTVKASDEVIVGYRDPAHYLDNVKGSNQKSSTSLPLVITKKNMSQFNWNDSNIFYGLAEQTDKQQNHRKNYRGSRSLFFTSSPTSVNDTTIFLTSGKVANRRLKLGTSESDSDIVTSKYPLEYLSSGSVTEGPNLEQFRSKLDKPKYDLLEYSRSKQNEADSVGLRRTYKLIRNRAKRNRLSRSQIFLKLNTSMSVGTPTLHVSDVDKSNESDSDYDIITSKYPFEYLTTGNTQTKATSPITKRLDNSYIYSKQSNMYNNNNSDGIKKQHNFNELNLDMAEDDIVNNRVDRSPKLQNDHKIKSFINNSTEEDSIDNKYKLPHSTYDDKLHNSNITASVPLSSISIAPSKNDKQYLPVSLKELLNYKFTSQINRSPYNTLGSNLNSIILTPVASRTTNVKELIQPLVARRSINIYKMPQTNISQRSPRARGRSYDKLWRYELSNLSRSPRFFTYDRPWVRSPNTDNIRRYRGSGRNRFPPPLMIK